MKRLCDNNCNDCELLSSENSRQISLLLNTLEKIYGEGVVQITNKVCPNLTCCADCSIDDFSHYENCEIEKLSTTMAKEWITCNKDD